MRSAQCYEAVFGWAVRSGGDEPSFEDGAGHVIGHWVIRPAGGIPTVQPYVYVDDIGQTLDRIVRNGGSIVDGRFPEDELGVATFQDPAGNAFGLWQRQDPDQ